MSQIETMFALQGACYFVFSFGALAGQLEVGIEHPNGGHCQPRLTCKKGGSSGGGGTSCLPLGCLVTTVPEDRRLISVWIHDAQRKRRRDSSYFFDYLNHLTLRVKMRG